MLADRFSAHVLTLPLATRNAVARSQAGVSSPGAALKAAYALLSDGNARRFVLIQDALDAIAFDDTAAAMDWLAANAKLTGTNGAALQQSGRTCQGVVRGGERCYLFSV